MSSEIIVAIITGSITLFGVIIANNKQSAVIQNEIKHLSEEVKKHNGFATRIPVIERDIEEANRRIEVLESKN